MSKSIEREIYESLIALYKVSEGREIHIISTGLAQPASIIIRSSDSELSRTGQRTKVSAGGMTLREALANANKEMNTK